MPIMSKALASHPLGLLRIVHGYTAVNMQAE